MRVLIAGGAGYAGSSLVRAASQAGRQLIVQPELTQRRPVTTGPGAGPV